MSLTEIVVLVGGLILGFGLVYGLMGNKPKAADRPPQHGRGHGGNELESSWFRILEVRHDASREEIDAAYRNRISQYHPDKVATMGVDIRRLAEAKSQEINAAYAYALQRISAQGR